MLFTRTGYLCDLLGRQIPFLVFVASLLPSVAWGNIYGASPSLEAQQAVQTCSAIWDRNIDILELRRDYKQAVKASPSRVSAGVRDQASSAPVASPSQAQASSPLGETSNASLRFTESARAVVLQSLRTRLEGVEASIAQGESLSSNLRREIPALDSEFQRRLVEYAANPKSSSAKRRLERAQLNLQFHESQLTSQERRIRDYRQEQSELQDAIREVEALRSDAARGVSSELENSALNAVAPVPSEAISASAAPDFGSDEASSFASILDNDVKLDIIARALALQSLVKAMDAPLSHAYLADNALDSDSGVHLETSLTELRGKLARDYLNARCDLVLQNPQPLDLRGERRPNFYGRLPEALDEREGESPVRTTSVRPRVETTTGARVRLLLGAHGSGSAGSPNPDFAPSFGFNYSDNRNVFTLLIDPRVAEWRARELKGNNARRELGFEMLNPQLAAQSVYLNYAWYPHRRPALSEVLGMNMRLVAQRLNFRVLDDSDETEIGTGVSEGLSAGFDAYLVSPTVSFAVASTGIAIGGSVITVGFQAGLTGRFLMADFNSLEEELRSTLGIHSRRHGLWAIGIDVSAFMQYEGIAPYVRLTLLDGPDDAPRSVKGFQMVFGVDVIASFQVKGEKNATATE